VWNIFPDDVGVQCDGGVILMEEGVFHDIQIGNISKVLDGVNQSLSRAHEAGYCHCDIRPCNILYFYSSAGYQLIDYDMAISSNAPLTFVDGAQFRNRGYRFRNATSDDYEMLIELIKVVTETEDNAPYTPPHSRSVYAGIDGFSSNSGSKRS
jgi:serine/threonine protein kinase